MHLANCRSLTSPTNSSDEAIFLDFCKAYRQRLLSPQVFALLRVTFAEGRERSMAFAAMGVVIGLGYVVGQILGGVLVQADLFGFSWCNSVFLVNIPIGIGSLAVAPFVLVKTKRSAPQRLDLTGVALSTIGRTLLMVPLIEGPELRWPTRGHLPCWRHQPPCWPSFTCTNAGSPLGG